MRRKSQKRREQDAEINDLDIFAQLFLGLPCWLCGHKIASQIHHWAGRNSKYRHHRSALFATCDTCHEEWLPRMDIVAVSIIRRLRDPEGWDEEIARILLKSKGGRIDL